MSPSYSSKKKRKKPNKSVNFKKSTKPSHTFVPSKNVRYLKNISDVTKWVQEAYELSLTAKQFCPPNGKLFPSTWKTENRIFVWVKHDFTNVLFILYNHIAVRKACPFATEVKQCACFLMGLPYLLFKILILIQIFHITHPSSYFCIIFPGYRNFPEYGRIFLGVQKYCCNTFSYKI